MSELASESGSQPVTVETVSGVVTATIDDGKANALTFDVIAALRAAVASAAERELPLVIAGRPDRFCAGFDLTVMRGDDLDATARLMAAGAELFRDALEAPVPVVAACTGHALAAGALLLLAADHRIGVPGPYKIGLNEVRIAMALPPFAIAMARHRLALRHLTSATMFAEVADSSRAIELGYLDELADDPVAAAHGFAVRLADELDHKAFRATKRRIRQPLLDELGL